MPTNPPGTTFIRIAINCRLRSSLDEIAQHDCCGYNDVVRDAIRKYIIERSKQLRKGSYVAPLTMESEDGD